MQYTDETLNALRQEGDPLADAVIAALVAGGEIESVSATLRHLQTNDEPIPADLPLVVQAYLRATDNPPPGIDPDRIARVHQFFLDDGLEVSAVLSLGAMVGCYAVPHGAKLLTMTHRLNHPARRMAETGQFCFHLMGENAFESGGTFVPAVQKVRLIHAAVRYFLSQGGAWSVAELGVPISQEDLLGALMLFSSQVLGGMERLGVAAGAQEAEDYYYVWRMAGVMLGIRADIIPPTLAEAHGLNELLKKRHLGPSAEGVQLTQDLVKLYEDMIPGRLFDGAVPALIRFVVEDEIADWMELPRSGWDTVMNHVPTAGHLWEGAADSNALIRKVLDRASQAMLMGQLRVFTGGQGVQYDIPADLRDAWGLKAAAGERAST